MARHLKVSSRDILTKKNPYKSRIFGDSVNFGRVPFFVFSRIWWDKRWDKRRDKVFAPKPSRIHILNDKS